jgi:hypothetical protein
MRVLSTQTFGAVDSGGPCACGGPYVSFDIAYARSGKHEGLKKVLTTLLEERRLKVGAIYRCEACRQPWFLDAFGRMLHRVPREREALLEKWGVTELVPSNEHRAILRSIGGSGADLYGNSAGELRFPCSVRLPDCVTINPALLVLTKAAPIGGDMAILYDSALLIEPTPFSLPPAVRLATLRAEEVRMGFAPTAVSTRDGRHFVLNWSCELVHVGDVRGEDLALTHDVFDATRANLLSAASTPTTYVYADWYEGAEALALHADLL